MNHYAPDDRDRRNLIAEVASLVTHQLHQPLTAIVNYSASARTALNRENPDPAEVAQHLERISEQAFRAAQVSRKLRDLVRRPAAAPEELPVRVEVERAWRALDPPTTWALELDVGEGTTVTVDPGQFRYLVEALLSNCADSLRAREGSDGRVRVAAARGEDGDLELTFEDDGAGFATDDPSTAFTAFYTTRPGRLGLGLSVARSIAADHGGRLRAEAAATGGAILRLSLPGKLGGDAS